MENAKKSTSGVHLRSGIPTEDVRRLIHDIRNALFAALFSLSTVAEEDEAGRGGRLLHCRRPLAHAMDLVTRFGVRHLAHREGTTPEKRMALEELVYVARSVTSLGYRSDISVQTEYGEGTRDLVLPYDRVAFTAAVANLLQNAVDAIGTDKGDILLQCALVPCGERKGDGALTVAVSDTGCGLATPFTRPASTKPAGSGLGLTIVREFVEPLGGSFELVNNPNLGAVARMRLPLPGG